MEEPNHAREADQLRQTIVQITAVPESFGFLRGQIGYARHHGFEVKGITSPGLLADEVAAREGIEIIPIPIHRKISPIADVVSIYRVTRTLRAEKPDIVHAHTPKGGLVGMIAATLAGVPVRIYHIRGLPHATATGTKRRLLMASEWLSAKLAHQVFAVSHSMARIAAEDHLVKSDKIIVFGAGSGNGVDSAHRFNPDAWPADRTRALRTELGIAPDDVVITFIGRLAIEKGIRELITAWQSVRTHNPHARLMIVGPIDARDGVPQSEIDALAADPRVILTGRNAETAPYYAISDLVVLPTWREGFPNVVLEASAMTKPVVTTDVPGALDSVVDGVTGTLVPVRNPDALAAAINAYVDSPDLRADHGNAARDRVVADFQPERIWQGIIARYTELLRDRHRI